MSFDISKYVFLPEEDIQKHGGFVYNFQNRWWLVHPEKGLVFFLSGRARGLQDASPLCNHVQGNIDRLKEQFELPFEVEVKFFPSVLQPIDPSDFC